MQFIASGLFACLLICHIGNCFEDPLKNSNEHLKESMLMKYKPMMQIMLKMVFCEIIFLCALCVCVCVYRINSINNLAVC